jgi:cytochrome c-type biogenesis protein
MSAFMAAADNVGYGAAFVAGVVSFLSPCVLPLVPGYISFMSGLTLDELNKEESKGLKHAGWESLCFVAGFALVFTALGASATAAGRFLTSQLFWISKVAGVVIVAFGLHLMGVMPISFLYYQKRADIAGFKPGYLGSFMMGLAFAFGWTPCIGPILGAILAVAAAQETVGRGMTLLLTYSLGLGVPFIATGFALGGFMRFFSRYKRHIRKGEILAGALLVLIGALIFSGRLRLLLRFLPASLERFQL